MDKELIGYELYIRIDYSGIMSEEKQHAIFKSRVEAIADGHKRLSAYLESRKYSEEEKAEILEHFDTEGCAEFDEYDGTDYSFFTVFPIYYGQLIV